jgi:hypothetical protein
MLEEIIMWSVKQFHYRPARAVLSVALSIILSIYLSVSLSLALSRPAQATAKVGTKAIGDTAGRAPSPNSGRKDPVAADSTLRPVRDKWALVVGISHFANPSINLKYPAKDAEDFSRFLIEKENFAADHVRLLTDQQATRANILSTLGDKWLPRVALPEDLVVIYISSHGSPADIDVGGVNYLVAYDTDINSLYATGIPLQDLMRIIKARVHADRVMIVLDACHSGAASADAKGLAFTANVSAEAVSQGTGQLVIASSKTDQVSWEGKEYSNSVFTHYLMEGLSQAGSATKLGAAFGYMSDRVEEEVLRDRGVLQNPVLKSHWQGGDLAIGAPPARPRAGLVDDSDLAGSTVVAASASGAAGISDSTTGILAAPPPQTVLNVGNIYAVGNRPSQPTTFKLDEDSNLIYLRTYHWNDGRGKPPGTISLRHEDGTVYGPFEIQGKNGQGGVPDAYWECEPGVVLKSGGYLVVDSDPASWSQNDSSGNRGFAKVKVVPVSMDPSRVKHSPVVSLFNNGNIYRVFNKPARMTTFTLASPTLITSLMTYHWNDGGGQDPGSITLMHQDGTRYGPWQAHGSLGQGGVPDAYWMCEPNVVVKAGVYVILDSDSNTWAQNDLSQNAGICEIKGVLQ